MNSTLGSVVPLAMLLGIYLDLTFSLFKFVIKPSFACQGIIILLSFNFKYYLIFAASVFSGLLQLCSRITNRFCTADQIWSPLPSSSILILQYQHQDRGAWVKRKSAQTATGKLSATLSRAFLRWYLEIVDPRRECQSVRRGSAHMYYPLHIKGAPKHTKTFPWLALCDKCMWRMIQGGCSNFHFTSETFVGRPTLAGTRPTTPQLPHSTL